MGFLAIVGGAVCGMAAAALLVPQLRADEVNLGKGFGMLIVSFLLIQAAMFVVHAWVPHAVVPFGLTSTLVFLGCVTAAVVRSGR